jgi:hypothetical protein
MLVFLDIFFVIFHSALVVFNITGWIWRRFYGFGYCPSTDWHWQVKRALGETSLPTSYVKYYLDRLTGLDWSSSFVDNGVAVLGIAALIVSIVLNLRDRAVEPR